MSMASVHAGSFDIENEKLVFRAAGKQDEVSCIFEWEVKRLNEYARVYEWTFVSVCANQSTVFVAINDIYFNMVKVYEIDAKNPEKFETIEEKTSINGTVNPLFGNKVRVKMMRCSGIDQAAVLIIDEDDFGRVWLRLSKYQGDYQYADESKHGVDTWKEYTKTWLECPVYYNNREQDIAMIVCGELHCAALTTEGNVFTCVIPESFTYEIGMENNLPTWIISGNLAALAFEGGDCQRALQTIVDDMDVELRYKTDCNPMAASFGVTGGLRNPYLLNINTDGIHAEKVAKEYETKQNDLDVNFKNQVASHLLQKNRIKKEAETHTREVADLEDQVESHKRQGEHYETHLQSAKEALEEAQNLHKQAVHAHSQHETELNRLNRELNAKVKGTKSVHTDTRSTNPNDYPERDNRSTASLNPEKKGIFSSLFGKKLRKPTKSENELHFEDIAHFSASRENRCTYI